MFRFFFLKNSCSIIVRWFLNEASSLLAYNCYAIIVQFRLGKIGRFITENFCVFLLRGDILFDYNEVFLKIIF